MPDIAMCLNNNCPIKHSCLRHTAMPDYRQSYSMFTPNKKNKKTECNNLLSNIYTVKNTNFANKRNIRLVINNKNS